MEQVNKQDTFGGGRRCAEMSRERVGREGEAAGCLPTVAGPGPVSVRVAFSQPRFCVVIDVQCEAQVSSTQVDEF